MAERVDLPGVPWNAGACQGVVGEGHRLHLPIGTHMERVCSERVRTVTATVPSTPKLPQVLPRPTSSTPTSLLASWCPLPKYQGPQGTLTFLDLFYQGGDW